jgi:hypothetical protein
MKKLIQNTGGYQLYAELAPIEAMKGENVLKFTTVYDHAKDPDDQHTPFMCIMDDAALQNLKDLINGNT